MASNITQPPSNDDQNRRAELALKRRVVLEAVLGSATASVVTRSLVAMENNQFFSHGESDEEKYDYVVRQTLHTFGIDADNLDLPSTIQNLLARGVDISAPALRARIRQRKRALEL